MFFWLRRKPRRATPIELDQLLERLRQKYLHFRQLLTLNTECLELIAGLQEDLRYVLPRRDVVAGRVTQLFEKAASIVAALDELEGIRHEELWQRLELQRDEVERFTAAQQELISPRLSAWLHEVGLAAAEEVGGKAAVLGEIKRTLKVPVPDGYVITTEAYWRFCGLPLWQQIRDVLRDVDPDDPKRVAEASAILRQMVMEAPIPRAVEVAVVDRARALVGENGRLAVRSSAVGEGPEGASRTYAGQFLSLLNVPVGQALEAYRQVVASRFSERAIAYRLATGVPEVRTPMAVLFLPVIHARASGILYTRDPSNRRSEELWITSVYGLGLDIASGQTPADLFIVSRKRGHEVVDQQLAEKSYELRLASEAGVERVPVESPRASQPSLSREQIRQLASYGVELERHFGAPQDVEWAVDIDGRVWILQSRPLALVQARRNRAGGKPKGEPVASGGRTIFPGHVSGPACIVEHVTDLRRVPEGAIVLMRRASPEISQVVCRIAGLVAETGNITGHAAALLREFRVPSVFLMKGAMERVRDGEPLSLDASSARLYRGTFWAGRQAREEFDELYHVPDDPIHRNILTLTLTDPQGPNFRPSGCRSVHDVLRYCHEKAVEAMFTVGDIALEQAGHGAKELQTDAPLNLVVLDLGGGLSLADPQAPKVRPEEIVSRPFRALWRGASRPDVSWKREMPASLSDLASVVASSFRPQEYAGRPLGGKSYLLVAYDYMNLNARLAYHFSLVDASLTDNPNLNYIAFRFAGGGSTAYRRSLRAQFVEQVLTRYGFVCDRRGDLVNAWLKKAPPEQTEYCLDILGRLLACTSQLDMYMASPEVMRWYVEQFLIGNYKFDPHFAPARPAEPVEKS